MDMKGFWFLLAMFLTIGSASLVFASNPTTAPMFPGSRTLLSDASSVTVKCRKLEDSRGDSDDVHLDDYRPIDPVPSSKASIRPGPIQHSSPLMPYIPKPAPPPDLPLPEH